MVFGAHGQSRAQVRLLSQPRMCFYTRPIQKEVFIVFGVKEKRERKGKGKRGGAQGQWQTVDISSHHYDLIVIAVIML